MPEKFSVLLVEDDDDARINMEDILSLDGYKIQSVSHCLPAIEAVENEIFDAVIVDWRLPDGDGGRLISLIVEHQPDTPVVVVTGMREFDTAIAALRCGAYDFLPKPVNPDMLRAVLHRLVERKKHLTEIRLSEQKLVANERLAAIGQMVAGLAHESRNAFQRSHACLAELTLDLQEMPDSLLLVRRVQKALDDLHFLLEEVREYSAPINLERQPCSVGVLIGETWQQILDAKSSGNPPSLNIVRADHFPTSCFVDPDRIRQVIRNLLENAFFACTGNGAIQVDLEVKSGKTLCISVSDDGSGVPHGDRETIFTPFFTTKTKGTGLGLAISRRIVEAHMGSLYANDGDLGGARFVVELPMIQK